MYFSDKDDKHTQAVAGGNTWQLMVVNGRKTITPTLAGPGIWGYYLRIAENPNKDRVKLKTRWLRDPKGSKNFTGQSGIWLDPGELTEWSRTWLFCAVKGQPVGIQIKHTGKLPIVLATREDKLWVPNV